MKSIRLLFPLLLLTGCLIEPVEDNFTKVNPEPDKALKSDVYYTYDTEFFPLVDTLWMYNNAWLYVTDGSAYRYEVSIDDEIVRPYNSPETIFDIPDLAPGSYSLRVKQLARSGTGSLADHSGAEYVEYTNTYVLMVSDDLYVPVITSIENVDGTVKLSWPKINTGLFSQLRLLKYVGTETIPYRFFTFTDRSVTGLVDTTYVGQQIRYRLEVTQGGIVSMSPEKEFYVAYAPNMTLTVPAVGRLKLTWKTPPVFRNVHHFQISSGGGAVIIQDNVDPSIRSIEFDGSEPYGYGTVYRVRLVSKVPDGIVTAADAVHYQEPLAVGERLRSFSQLRYNTSDDVFYLAYEPFSNTDLKGYYKLDESFNVLDSILLPYDLTPINLVVSPNGQHLYTFKNFLLERRNMNNLADKITYPLGDLGMPIHPYESFYKNESFAVSDNNRLLVRMENASLITAYILDMNIQQKIFSLTSAGFTHLSGDGTYFINNNSLYKFNGTTYVADFILPYAGIKYVQFLEANPDEVVLLTPTQVIRYNCDTHTEVVAWNCSPASRANAHLDQTGMKLLFREASVYMTVDLLTGALRNLTDSEYFTLEDDILFNANGFAIRNY